MNKEEVIGTKKKLGENKRLRGVYFLIKNNEIVYVGQSTDIFSRISVHRKTKDFDSYNYILFPEVSDEKLNNLEAEYIGKFTPKYNRQISNNDIYNYVFDTEKLGYDAVNQKINIEISIVNNRAYILNSEFEENIIIRGETFYE